MSSEYQAGAYGAALAVDGLADTFARTLTTSEEEWWEASFEGGT